MKNWILKRNKVDSEKMGKALGISDITAYVMANRGINKFNDAIEFLNCDINSLSDISIMKDVKKAVNIILEKIDNNKKIAIYGDYDVDGVMSTVILYTAFDEINSDVIYYIPDRQKEGYGLNKYAIKKIYDMGVDTILTCDNGISAIDEIKYAKELGLTVIIIDHHEPTFEIVDNNKYDILPCADAIIDTKQKNCDYSFKKMCAAAISYRFVTYLFECINFKSKKINEYIVFSGIATICDVVDLLYENRVIVKNCLNNINNTTNIGLKALIDVCGLSNKKINEYNIGFTIGPCINATGRLENAKFSVELFIEYDSNKAYKLAKTLFDLNNERKNLTVEATNNVIDYIECSEYKNDDVFVIYDERINESIAGIVAGRIKERFYKPVIIITNTEQSGIVKGSGRSIEGYDMFNELLKCSCLFIKFGGHTMAAGMSLKKENINILREKLNKNSKLTDKELTPIIKIEKQLDIENITINIAKNLNVLSPFGKENPYPLFGSKNVMLEKIYLIGKNKDIIKFVFKTGGINSKRVYGISFDCYYDFVYQIKCLYGDEICDKILSGNVVNIFIDIIYSIDINCYDCVETVQLNIKDLRLCQ